ncbi:MAG: amino acid dehydrogenase [Hyphomicrobiales bacterium]|nr:amino acid dehydrogenase [Hyphomicrobiales bacterium]
MKTSSENPVFGDAAFAAHEQVVFAHDAAAGLKAIIAVHNTTLGRALGGTRMWAYDTEVDALRDVLRLAQGMTFKNALAGVPFGGGKAVIIGDAAHDKSPELFRAMGRAIDRLDGWFVTGEDVGISVADAEEMRKTTTHVRGIAEGGAGDPSPTTAYGVFKGMEAAAQHRFGVATLKDQRVCVQGLGAVGMMLCKLLHGAGAQLLVADIRNQAVREAGERFGATAVLPDKAHAADCDIFAPCALGAGLNARTIRQIRARVVAGSANNQLARTVDGARLSEYGILYAPDYVINAGGVISIAHEGPNFDCEAMLAHVARIGDTLQQIFASAERDNLPTSLVADRMAQECIAAAYEENQAA